MSNLSRSKMPVLTTSVFVGCGWLLSGWLLLRAFSLGTGQVAWLKGAFTSAPCPGCDEILASSSSWLLGLPIAGWGVIYFAFLACLLSIRMAWANRTALLLTACGAGVSAALSVALLAAGLPICGLCLLVHACNFFAFAAAYILVRNELSAPGHARLFSFSRWRAAMVICAALLGGLVQGAVLKSPSDVRRVVQDYGSAHQFKIPVLRDDPILGLTSAPVQLVVFSSFQCPACRAFARIAHQLNEQFPSSIKIVFKNYPLGKDCNSDLIREMQPRACAAAFAAEAANRQGEFWRYHDEIFFHSSLKATEPELEHMARTSGLEIAQWESDRRSPAIEMRVKVDVGLGHILGVNGTPAIFLDGRHVPETNLPILKALIRREIDQSRSAARSRL